MLKSTIATVVCIMAMFTAIIMLWLFQMFK